MMKNNKILTAGLVTVFLAVMLGLLVWFFFEIILIHATQVFGTVWGLAGSFDVMLGALVAGAIILTVEPDVRVGLLWAVPVFVFASIKPFLPLYDMEGSWAVALLLANVITISWVLLRFAKRKK